MKSTAAATTPGEPLAARVFIRKKQGQRHRSCDEPVLITLELIQPLFDLSIKEAALRLNLCPTALKNVCRKLGIARWPFKQHRINQRASQGSPSSNSATERELSSTPSLTPSLAELRLETPLPGDDTFMREHTFSGSGFSRSSTPCTAPTECVQSVMVVPAPTFPHALASPQLGDGWGPDFSQVALMHAHMFPSLYSPAAKEQQWSGLPAHGDDLASIASGFGIEA